ncbi:BatA domain-containing protein [Hymenobacter volaticus]|uniref:BatA domain-containing protein n=1 Tax=Hymenobacter volaticus TaxID=2932254 RepID=A0ABY4G336_9BACT|nr:BatA domain-containing protein [Hymenobacter volaticus]UOQ65089.1 BatA domain-containing protein [Hymenobacter volaticus]
MAIAYPWFLLGLISLVVPIAIHLFELRRPKRVLFTNVGFIREVKLVTARQRKLKHLLVLVARIGFLTFLVFMFVQPYIPAPVESNNAQTQVGVVVDTSPSMQAGLSDDQSLFEQAVKQARELPAAYPATTNFVMPTVTQSLSTAAYQVVIDKLRVSGQENTAASNLLRLQRGKGTEQAFIFSDFQKNSFSIKALNALDSTQQVFLVPVGGKEVQNAFVDSVWSDDAFIRSNTDLLLNIRLRNGGNKAVENCQAKLYIGEKQAAVFRVIVPVDKPVTTTVRVRVEGEQLTQCRIELEDYPVVFDNKFYFTLQPSPKIKILDVATGATATRQLYANEPLFSYGAAKPGSSDYRQVEEANLIVLQGQERIDVGLRESLKRVVQRGGSVVIVPPSGVAGRASYDQLFEEFGIGPVQWEKAGLAPALREVAVPSAQSPFFKDVFGAQNRQPVMPKASPVLSWSRSGADIMRMRDGDGFLGSYSSGKGTVYLFSAPFDNAYSDFTQHALFVPVMYRLAMQSYQRQQQPAYRLNQGTIALNVAEATATAKESEQVFKLSKDSSTFIPSQRLQAGVLRFDVPAEMREPGFYNLTSNNRVVATVAFNFDKRESELAAYSADELRQLVGANHPNIHVYDASTGESVAAKYRAERVGTPLWQYCLWAALVCLLAEVLLLRFFRQPRAVEATAVAA